MLDETAWIEHAESLIFAADAIAEKLEAIVRRSTPQSQIRKEMLGLTRGYMTLLGASFECMLKAIAISRGKLNASDNQVDFENSFEGAKTHDLHAMAVSLKLELLKSEQDLLMRASEYLNWAGRYPTAKKRSRTSAAYAKRKIRWQTSDRQLSRNLMARLLNTISGKGDGDLCDPT